MHKFWLIWEKRLFWCHHFALHRISTHGESFFIRNILIFRPNKQHQECFFCVLLFIKRKWNPFFCACFYMFMPTFFSSFWKYFPVIHIRLFILFNTFWYIQLPVWLWTELCTNEIMELANQRKKNYMVESAMDNETSLLVKNFGQIHIDISTWRSNTKQFPIEVFDFLVFFSRTHFANGRRCLLNFLKLAFCLKQTISFGFGPFIARYRNQWYVLFENLYVLRFKPKLLGRI